MAGFRAPSSSLILPCALILLILYVRPTHAFGAGNIASTSKIEGANWRHGDIEDTLLTLLMTRASGGKKFSKLDVKRVYFGNWLRDYSQAVDVGTVKMVSAEAIRLLLWILGFLSFGFGTGEFEVTHDRLGCYRPEEHIDNPKDYADNLDARQYDRRLRGPVDERRELSMDDRTGMKNYIANENAGITTSAGMVRDLYRRCIQLARQSKRNGNKNDLYEAFRLLGTANHCLEDFSAHSNYVELCLIEMGERNVFPHVGRRTQINIRGARGPVWPLITGTFGGVDFLHSVMGELSDKATQSEIQELEGTISEAENNRQNVSMIKDLLDKLPSGLFGSSESSKVDELQANTAAAQMQNMHVSPKQPEEFTRQMIEISKQIYPVLQFHDDIMHKITETIENIPILPDLIEQLQEQISIFVFSLIAPFILPVIKQIKEELATGSSEVIQSSREKQHIVFNDDNCTDPTHSMISKDHFSNILNEPAGKVASGVLKWVVPQIVECWDDERADAERTINRIINGVFHHPSMREYGDDGARDVRQQMFRIVESWWREKSDRGRDEFRDKLSREGVQQGRNHKEGIHDTGHGCGKPLGMPNYGTAASSGAIGGVLGAGVMGALSQSMGGSMGGQQFSGRSRNDNMMTQQVGQAAGDAIGGGVLGDLVGGVVGGVGASLLGGAFSEPGDKHGAYKQSGYGNDGSFTQSYTETAHRPGGSYGQGERTGQAMYKSTDFPTGGRREEYSRYEQDTSQGTTGYGFQQTVESKPTYGGGYERTEEKRYERTGGQWESERRTEGVRKSGEYYSSEAKHHGSSYNKSDDDDDDYAKKERKRREKEEKKREKERRKQQGYGSEDSDDADNRNKRRSKEYGRRKDDDEDDSYGSSNKHHSGGHGRQHQTQEQSHGSGGGYGGGQSGYSQQESGYGGGRSEYGRQESSAYGGGRSEHGRQQSSSYGEGESEYGRQESSGYSGGRSEYGRQESSEYGRQESSGYGGQSGYGRQERPGYGGGSSGYGRQESYGGSGGYGRSEEGGYGRGEDDEDEYGSNSRRRQQGGYGGGYGESQGW